MMSLAMLPLFFMMSSAASADMVTVAKGTLSGVELARQVVVGTDAEWRSLWQEHAPEQQVPTVDFTRRTVLAVFLGSRNTAGYSVTISAVEKAGTDGVRVRYRETRPGPDQVLAQIITSPFHIVSVPRIDAPVSFVGEHDH